MPLPIGQVDAQLDVDVPFVMQFCQQPSIGPVHVGSTTGFPPQSGSHAQPDWQVADVSQLQLAPQSGSHAQPLSHALDVSQAHPPSCSQR